MCQGVSSLPQLGPEKIQIFTCPLLYLLPAQSAVCGVGPPAGRFYAPSRYRSFPKCPSFPTFLLPGEPCRARRPPSPQYGRRWCVPALVRSVYDTSRPTLAHSRPVSTLNRTTDTPKSGPTSVQPHTRTTRRTRESACDTVTSDPVPRPHGGYGRGGDSYRRLQHGGMPMCAINARGGGLSMRPAAAAPVDSRHVAKSRRRVDTNAGDDRHDRTRDGNRRADHIARRMQHLLSHPAHIVT